MGFTSQDDLINEITVNGKFRRVDMFKSTTPAYTAGSWHMLTGLLGFPNQGLFPGTDLVWQNCAETSGDGSVVIGPQHAGVVGPADTKHILNVGASIIAAAGGPWQAKLVDLQGYYRLSTTNVTGVTSRVLINSNAVTASSSGGLLLTSTNDFSLGIQSNVYAGVAYQGIERSDRRPATRHRRRRPRACLGGPCEYRGAARRRRSIRLLSRATPSRRHPGHRGLPDRA